MTFLDASKTFDRIDHWLLFKTLIDKHIPLFIINSNGVKQGGILSAIIFNVYMDQLSVKLNASNIGRDIGGVFLNHIFYADEICLISLSQLSIIKHL